MTTTVLAWHFLAENGKLRDGRTPPADGEVLAHDGPLVLCESGLHASVRAYDALQYAPGSLLCRVECSGEIEHDTDKLVCSRRTILWRADATETLRAFARWCALDVAHLWDMPQIVRDYLETGDESKRAAASAAARAAASAAAWDAARDAAWAAAWDAAWDAARDAASAAARDAASAAAWAAARDAAWAAARDAKLQVYAAELERRMLALEPQKAAGRA